MLMSGYLAKRYSIDSLFELRKVNNPMQLYSFCMRWAN